MKKLSKCLPIALAVCLLCSAVAQAAAWNVQATLEYSNIGIIVDGKTIIPTDVNGKVVEPFIIEGTTYVPIRAISEALDCDVSWDNADNTVYVNTTSKKLLYTFIDDAEALITDSFLDWYFKEGTALAGVEALLNAGGVYVNGQQVPFSEDVTDSFEINGFSSLWKTGDGTWAYSVHKLYSATDLTFQEARLGFVQSLSKMRGLTMKLYSTDGSNFTDRIETTIKETTLINTMTVDGENTKITRYDFALATDEDRPDVNDIIFPTKNVDPALEVGDLANYWFDGEWHVEKGVARQGIVTKGDGDFKYVLNGVAYTDTRTTRFNLQAANRTSQFLNAHVNLGLEGIEAVMWFTDTGYAIGYTRGDNAPAALRLAIQNAEKAKAGVDASKNAEALAAFQTAIAEAQTVLNSDSSTNIDMDMAIYQLSSALTAFRSAIAEA